MKVMIVEDEMLLAMELEIEVEAAGHEVAGIAMNSRQAHDLLAAQKPDFAFVDVQLMDGPTGIEVGRSLAAAGIPYVFVTGNIKRLPPDFVDALGAIEKPYTMNGMKNALNYISAILSGNEGPDIPPNLVLANDSQPQPVNK
ncbi:MULTISPECIES: response regulator [Rhizobium]|uniref:Response regulator receiver protein n=1 Tax=Rhizobium leguminosarum bv. trifolii (strain WSM1325) TaxID=395491 RepID=C6B7A9_RHILS|nr:response regulator [Rhizobium leguminosarum]ACS59967.1 response regulator receiver protein [Rhizobium leguminosarum bv. trifolii WSM1325]MBY2933823.1 response regulator [Rhizobium leguminosarum]MBY2942922.1 response regulator [Rhizobium leguminosarum]MBY2963407.1 response regulator [Rhizobium leguminosarum]MBY2994129.1 response regulator [Rhizobium leguminosarum]